MPFLTSSVAENISTLGGIILSLTFLYIASLVVYNVYFHPLCGFPGPKLAAATQYYWAWFTVRGQSASKAQQLLSKYGDAVRIAPNQLFFIGETAWKDIYMHRQGRPQFQKAGIGVLRRRAYNLLNAPDDIHARQRRMVAHAFSDRALRDQEPLLKTYVDLLMRNLHEDAEKNKNVDMVKAYNYTTFDIIGDFAFAEPFDNLDKRRDHPYMSLIFDRLRLSVILSNIATLPGFRPILGITFRYMQKNQKFNMGEFVNQKVTNRIENGNRERPDLMTNILKNNTEDGTGITRAEINSTASVIIGAGSETTATLLSGCTALLLNNPPAFEKLKAEIREEFESANEITLARLNKLPYLLAVLEESLRLYPPVPIALRRRTPPEGASVCGHWVPGNVIVGVPQLAAYSSPKNFTEPLSFIPERFLQDRDVKFENDKRHMLQPFSIGPRNCVGKNLAYSEMKLILARVMYDFDMEPVDRNAKWLDQRVFALWEKGPLMVKLKERLYGI